jgi:Inhibitor of Apoptosis domain
MNDIQQLCTEAVRFETFKDFPLTFLDKTKLAQTGFYNLGGKKGVMCFFCKVVIRRWYPRDEIITKHLKKSPSCPLLNREMTTNIPINACKLDRLLTRMVVVSESFAEKLNIYKMYLQPMEVDD